MMLILCATILHVLMIATKAVELLKREKFAHAELDRCLIEKCSTLKHTENKCDTVTAALQQAQGSLKARTDTGTAELGAKMADLNAQLSEKQRELAAAITQRVTAEAQALHATSVLAAATDARDAAGP